MSSTSGNRRNGGKERRKLAAYLAARSSHRFDRRRPVPKRAVQFRTRLLVVALALVGIGLWGVWREFFQ
jgi:hypothetical protein